jgi:hypothetical protein
MTDIKQSDAETKESLLAIQKMIDVPKVDLIELVKSCQPIDENLAAFLAEANAKAT